MNKVTCDLAQGSELPETVKTHPGMISPDERLLLFRLARDFYRGSGVIVDAGAFLGASTAALAYGVRENERVSAGKAPSRPIVSFERAVAGPNFARHAAKTGLPSIPVDESFEHVLRKQIEGFRDFVDLRVGNILEYSGNDLDEIEICFLDILKGEPLARHCVEIFYPKLTVGSFIIQQDYFFDGLPFIKLFTEIFSDHLSYLGEVRSSAVFRVLKPLPLSVVTTALEARSTHDLIALHKQAEARTTSQMRQYLMRLSRCRLLATLGDVNDARETWQQADALFGDLIFDGPGRYKPNLEWRISGLTKFLDRKS
jgi:predicted O-methyltransferase YrrM